MNAPFEIFFEEHHDIPIVEIVVATEGGSATDTVGREGALYLAFRALRRGAGKRSATEIDDAIDRLGAGFGASVDANGTNIHARVIRRNLEPFLDLLGDLVTRPTFPTSEIEQLIRENRADIVAARNDDRGLAARAFRRALFAGHPLGRPVNGTLETITTLDRELAENEYRRTLVRGNVLIGVAGDCDPSSLSARLNEVLGAIPEGASTAAALPEPAPPKGRHLLIVDKPDRTQSQIYIGGIGGHPFDPDHTALEVANTVFGGTFTSRLMREVRSKRGWSYGASSRVVADRGRDAWYMSTAPAATDAAACIALQLSLLESLVAEGITQRELDFTKKYLVNSFAFDCDTAVKRLSQRLETRLTPLPADYYKRYVQRVEAVTLAQANAALRKRISPENLIVSIVATADTLRADLEKAIPRLASTRVQPFDTDLIHRAPIYPTVTAGATPARSKKPSRSRDS